MGLFASVMRSLARLAGPMEGSETRTRYGDFFKLILAGLLRDSVMLCRALWCIMQRRRSAKCLILLIVKSLSWIPNPQVSGSIPARGTKEDKDLADGWSRRFRLGITQG